MVALVPLLVILVKLITEQAAANEGVVLTVKGLVTPVFTPVNEKGELNLDVIPEYAQCQKYDQMDGVLVSGTTGEGPKLCLEEAKSVLDAWLQAARPLGLTVMSQVGGRPMSEVIELARYSEEMCVDAILTLPDIYYKPQCVEELVYYMQCIASAAPNTPILYYHIPSHTNVHLDMVQFFEMATAMIPNFKGMKVTEFDVALQLRDKVKGDQRLFIAVDYTYLAPAVLMGFEDYILLETNMFPELTKQIIEDGQHCDFNSTCSNYETLQRYSRAMTCGGRSKLPAAKETMSLVKGICVGPIKEPGIPLTEVQKKELERDLNQQGVPMKGSQYE